MVHSILLIFTGTLWHILTSLSSNFIFHLCQVMYHLLAKFKPPQLPSGRSPSPGLFTELNTMSCGRWPFKGIPIRCRCPFISERRPLSDSTNLLFLALTSFTPQTHRYIIAITNGQQLGLLLFIGPNGTHTIRANFTYTEGEKHLNATIAFYSLLAPHPSFSLFYYTSYFWCCSSGVLHFNSLLRSFLWTTAFLPHLNSHNYYFAHFFIHPWTLCVFNYSNSIYFKKGVVTSIELLFSLKTTTLSFVYLGISFPGDRNWLSCRRRLLP